MTLTKSGSDATIEYEEDGEITQVKVYTKYNVLYEFEYRTREKWENFERLLYYI